MRREVGDLTRGLRAVGATELGRVVVAGFLQSWESMGEGSKHWLVKEGGQTGAVSFIDGRGDDGSTWEGHR
jgi:hypothetical protein